MNKKFYGTLLLGTLLLGSTIVSCKDYDDDIDNLQNQITQLATKADMQSEVSKLQSAVATAQAAAENKAAAAEQAAKDAAAKAQAAADAAAKAQGTADAAATVEALNKVAADAAAAAKAAEDAKAAAEAKAAELEAQLAELQALAATLVSTEDFEAAKKELNDKYAELAAKIGETTGTTGMTGLSIVGLDPASTTIKSGYGVWDGVHKGANAATWGGTRALPAKDDYVVEFGKPSLKIAVNPTDLDLSNTEFAVVNQFGDVAPIAFGTPTVPTRALSAGVYELKYTSAALTSESVQAFSKAFDGKDGGSTATLVAGNIAAQVTKDFVKIEKIKNGDKSKFETKVAYDEIANGTVVLEAVDAQYVYDSYIEQLDGTEAHDSLMWKLKYSGKDMTLEYNAAAIKKAVDANNGLTINLQVKQINLNGYIHTVKGDEAKIVFQPKAAAEDVVKEPVQIETVNHTIALNVLDKATGKDTDLQKQAVDITEAIKKWGLDDKKSDDYIHWNHGTITPSFGKAYYYDENNDAKEVKNIVSGDPVFDKATNIVTVKFKKDYQYDTFDTDPSKDLVFSGKTIYIPVTLTLADTEDKESNTIYNVVIPIKFGGFDASKYYNWDGKQSIKLNITAADITANGKLLPTTINSLETKDGTKVVSINWPVGKEYDAKHRAKGVTGSGYAAPTKYIVPAVTLSGDFTSEPGYKARVADINSKIDGQALPATDNLYGTPYDEVSDAYKNALKKALNAEYKNFVSVGFNADYQYFGVPAAAENKANEYWYYSDYYPASAHTNVTSISVPKIIFRAAPTALLNNTYTLSGFEIMAAGRKIASSVEVELSYNATSSSMTLTNSNLFNDPAAPKLRLENAARPAVDGKSFNGQFTIVDKYGYKLEVTGENGITAVAVDEYGQTTSLPTAGGAAITVTKITYGYKLLTNTPTYDNTEGLEISVKTAAFESEYKKVRVTIPAAKLRRIYDGVIPTEDVTFELNLVNE